MKVLIYGLNYTPELTGIGKYSGEMGVWMADQGHEVHAVTAPPYYPAWKINAGYSAVKYTCEIISKVKVWRCPLYVPGQPSGLRRILHLTSFALSSIPVMIRQIFWKPDVVVLIEPPLFCAPIAWLCARFSAAKSWLHIQDFEVDAAFDLGIIHFAWMKQPVREIEGWMMRRFDVVSTLSNSMINRLHKKGVADPMLFPNWSDLSHIRFDEAGRSSFRAELGIGNNETLCLYSGNIAVKQGLEVLLEVAERLPDCRFVICGDGANRKSLQAKVEKLRLTNILFIDLQPLNRLPAMLSGADIHLVIQKACTADLVMPSKLTNILAVGGVAIVTTKRNSELGQLGEGKSACLYRCDPDNANDLLEAIERLRRDSVLSTGLSERAKAYADSHIAMEQVLSEFEKRCESLVISVKKRHS